LIELDPGEKRNSTGEKNHQSPELANGHLQRLGEVLQLRMGKSPL